ncbi:hypothetical protein [Flavobacterium sp. 2]|uniref:hypothetical protein n=1 Tax=Flavobacterium sp. 2 TaxID=308053 RepID=UPI003CEFA5DA
METNKDIQKYAIIAGFLVCSIFPLSIFSFNFLVYPLEFIADFGTNGSLIFWGIIFPLFIVFIFGQSGKNISSSLSQDTKYEACSQFTFEVSLKIILALFIIYIIGLLLNGISFVLLSEFYFQILFSLMMILILSVILIVSTLFSSIIIVKQSLKTKL